MPVKNSTPQGESQDSPPADQTPVSPPPQSEPKYATKDDLAALQAAWLEQAQQIMQAAVQAVIQQTQASAGRSQDAQPKLEPPTEDEWAEAYKKLSEDGDGRMLARLQNRQFACYEQRTRQAALEEIRQLREEGLARIESLSRFVGNEGLEYADRFKDEIEQELRKLPREQAMDPAVRKGVHDYVVGRHAAELIREAREQAIRASQELVSTPSGDASGRSAQQSNTGPKIPGIDIPLRPETLVALDYIGKDLNQVAADMGYIDPSGRGEHWRYYQTALDRLEEKLQQKGS